MKNKKAQMQTETVITLIIAAAVLIVAFLMIFNVGGIRDKIFGFAGGTVNVDDIKLQCKTACSQLRENEYNGIEKAVVLKDKTKLSATCKALEQTIPVGCVYKNASGTEYLKLNIAADSKGSCTASWTAGTSAGTGTCKVGTVEISALANNKYACDSVVYMASAQPAISEPCSFG